MAGRLWYDQTIITQIEWNPALTDIPNSTAPLAGEEAPAQEYSVDDELIHIKRTTLNYVLIGFSFFVIGLVIGFLGYDRFASNNRAENEALLSAAASTFVASVPTSGAAVPTARPTLDPNVRYDIGPADNPAIGPEDAPITMIEFADFRCGYCKRFQDETLAPLLERYDGQIRFVYRDYPILSPDSLTAALAAECADDQGAFWEFHDRVYAEQNLARDVFIQYATDMGLDVDTFTTCLDEQVHLQEVMADYDAGSSTPMTGTPTFFINGRILIGAQPLNSFINAIDAELASLDESATTNS